MALTVATPQDHRSTSEIFRDQERTTTIPGVVILRDLYLSDKVDRAMKEPLERQSIVHKPSPGYAAETGCCVECGTEWTYRQHVCLNCWNNRTKKEMNTK